MEIVIADAAVMKRSTHDTDARVLVMMIEPRIATFAAFRCRSGCDGRSLGRSERRRVCRRGNRTKEATAIAHSLFSARLIKQMERS